MVQLTSPENNNGNIWEWPALEFTLPEEKTTEDLAPGKRAIKSEHVEGETPVHKRLKSSDEHTTNERNLDSNESLVLHAQCNLLNEPGPLGLRLKNSQSFLDLIQAKISEAYVKRTSKDVKAKDEVSAPVDKLKASNFPAVRLRIGQWEYVSKNEGDLVAKCYFAKHKLVWEVLDGRLKNKIEIQWGDIVSLKAHCPDNGPGIFTIVLGKQPLFFRETDPQPRKHTVWQATTDFTGGEASTYRQHYLECSQGVLNKHYEKLIQCDTRLNFLSQQADPISSLPFAAKDFVKDPNVINNNGYNHLGMPKGPMVSCLRTTGTLHLVHGHVESPGGRVGSTAFGQVNATWPQQTMSISDICVSEKTPAQVLPISNNNMSGENVCQILLNHDMQLTTAASDESNDYSDLDVGNYLTPDTEYENRMSRDDSFNEWLDQLPQITSLPRLLFKNPQDFDMMDF
ncbi:hypothetical protein SSX86_021366 [Deinandra increscens subsp. villosa]|uniref:TRF2/HOY1 PH-like domain-containing protein n=1 Tax=Deinandra increscens subsp. villosa TaxID=3103831 RepID=A0AAP0GVR8_9ASTR